MSGAPHRPAGRRRPARRHDGTRAGQGLPPPPTCIDEALDRASPRRRGALRDAFRAQAAAYNMISLSGQRAVLSALAFCCDADAVKDLIAAEVMRELDPRRAAECLRVARGRGLQYDHACPEHRARVACGWARRQHKARARTRARDMLIATAREADEADEAEE